MTEDDATGTFGRRRVLQVLAGTGVLTSGGIAGTATAQSVPEDQSETIIKKFSFEEAVPGAGLSTPVWSVVRDPTSTGFNSVEISEQRATDGSQTLHMSGNGELDRILVGTTVDLSDVDLIRCDTYLAQANVSWGEMWFGKWNGEATKMIGFSGPQTGGEFDATGQFTDLETDVSGLSGEHELVFNIRGYNEAYFDNLRLISSDEDDTPDNELLQLPFTENFQTGLNGWTVSHRYRTDPAEAPPNPSAGSGAYSNQYDGSVQLSVSGGPSTIGVGRRTAGISAGTTLSATIEIEDANNVQPGNVSIAVFASDGDDSPDERTSNGGDVSNGTIELTHTVQADYDSGAEIRVWADVWPGAFSAYVTRVEAREVIVDPPQFNSGAFDPATHGFRFPNYSTPDLPGFGETVTFVNDVLLTELRELRQLTEVNSRVIPPVVLAGIIYTAQEGGLTNGHCLGMVFTAREYYKTGIPADELDNYTPSQAALSRLPDEAQEEVQTPPQTAADLVDNPENTPALNPVEVAIDNRQQTQIFDSTHVLRYVGGIAAPQTGVGSINETEVLTAIKQQTDEGKTAPLSLLKTITSSHMVLAYDLTIGEPANETAIENATQIAVSVYDPNKETSGGQLEFKRESSADEFSMEEYEFGSTTAEKAVYIEEVDPDYQFFTDGAATDGFATAVSQGIESFLSVGVMSPVTVSVTRPDGSSLHEVPVSAEELTQQTNTDYEELHVGLGVSPGEYEIELTGTSSGEYTVEVTGAATDGGEINDRYTGEITEDEQQQLSASLPTEDSEQGSLEDSTEGGPDDGSEGSGGDGFGPGFEVGGALASLGGAAYLLKRRLETDENSEE